MPRICPENAKEMPRKCQGNVKKYMEMQQSTAQASGPCKTRRKSFGMYGTLRKLTTVPRMPRKRSGNVKEMPGECQENAKKQHMEMQ